MKNKILLCTLLSFSAITAPTATDADSAKAISKDTMDIGTTYYHLIKGCIDFCEGESDNKAPLIKILDIATELLPEIKEFAKSEAKTDGVHEKLYEYEQDIEPQIKMGITFLHGVITNPNMSNEQLREMLSVYIAMVPQIVKGAAGSIAA